MYLLLFLSILIIVLDKRNYCNFSHNLIASIDNEETLAFLYYWPVIVVFTRWAYIDKEHI